MGVSEYMVFAQTCTIALSDIARVIAANEKDPITSSRLTDFAARLCVLAEDLRTPTSVSIVRGKLHRYLIDIQKLCTWPSRTTSTLPRPTTSTSTIEPKDRYPLLNLYSIGRSSSIQLRSPLKAFVSEKNTKARETFYKNISRLCPRGKSAFEVPHPKGAEDDLLSHIQLDQCDVNNLWDNLLRLSHCCCDGATSSDGSRQHVMNLRLSSTIHPNDKSISLETVSQASESHLEQPPERGWRSIAFHVARDSSPTQDDTVAGADQDVDTPLPALRSREIGSSEFCRLLLHDKGPVQHQLRVLDDTIIDARKVVIAQQNIPLTPTVSLADMMTISHLSSDGKLLLAHALAHSVWIFYETKFMSTRWTQERVHFLNEYLRPRERNQASTPTFVNPNHVYVPMAFSAESSSTEDHEFVPGEGVVHWAPRIFSLGVILASIFGDEPAWLDNTKFSWQADLNTEAYTCHHLLSDRAWPSLPSKSENVRYRIRKVVTACLDGQAFNKKTLSARERREKLKNEVLWPLQYITGIEKIRAQNARWTAKQLSQSAIEGPCCKACRSRTPAPEQFSRLNLSESLYKGNQSRGHSKTLNGNVYVQGNYNM